MKAEPYKIPHPFRKLTKKLVDTLVNDIAEGSTHVLAAESNGITERIFYLWRAQGKVDIDTEQDTLCAYLVQSLAKVKKQEVQNCRNNIASSDKGHKGAEWTLEHAYARDFSGNALLHEFAREIEEFKAELLKRNSNGEKELDIGCDQT
jgi:hypothetical protein